MAVWKLEIDYKLISHYLKNLSMINGLSHN